MKRSIKIISALIISVFAVQPIMAQTPVNSLFENLLNNSIVVGSEAVEGYNQIYIQDNQEKIFITQGDHNFTLPDMNGDYVTYRKNINGQNQIFLYHVPTETTLQLTNTGNNNNPKVSSKGVIVWERWAPKEFALEIDNTDLQLGGTNIDEIQTATPSSDPIVDDQSEAGTPSSQIISQTPMPSPTPTVSRSTATERFYKGSWQIVVFDGTISRQITQSGIAVNPYVEGDTVVYSESLSGRSWTAKAYSVREKSIVDITTGREAKHPRLDNGKILLGIDGNTKFPLTVDDILLLDLLPLSGTPDKVTNDDIFDELMRNFRDSSLRSE